MKSLKVRTGEIKLNILDDYDESRGVFKFNPYDVKNATRFVELQEELRHKEVEFDTRADACTTDLEKGQLLTEFVTYFRNLIDECWGKGSSNILFGDACCLSMFEDFFDGVAPYYEQASKDRMSKYAE